MLDAAYRKRLAADLPKWLDAGWVSAESAAAILAANSGGRRGTFGFSAIMGTLGALLLGLAVIAFVGGQWEAVPRLVRVGLIAAALLIAYVAAFQFERRQLRIFAEAGLLAGGLIYGAAIGLVGQAYHLGGDFAGAMLLFEAGILGAALLTGSPAMTVLGLVGGGYWAWFATYDHGVVPHWPSLIAIALGVLLSTAQDSVYGRVVAVMVLMFWTAVSIAGLANAWDWTFAATLAVYAEAALATWALGAALAGAVHVPRAAALGEAILWPGLLAILVSLGVLQILRTPIAGDEAVLLPIMIAGAGAVVFAAIGAQAKRLSVADVFVVLVLAAAAAVFTLYLPADDLTRKLAAGAIVIVASVWAVSLGQSGLHPIGKSIGLVAFGIEVIILYVFTLGTELDTALAFLVGGLLFIVMTYVLFRIDRLLARRAAATAVVADLKLAFPPPPIAEPALEPSPEPPPEESAGEKAAVSGEGEPAP